MKRPISIPIFAALAFSACPTFANPEEAARVAKEEKDDDDGPFSLTAEASLGYDNA